MLITKVASPYTVGSRSCTHFCHSYSCAQYRELFSGQRRPPALQLSLLRSHRSRTPALLVHASASVAAAPSAPSTSYILAEPQGIEYEFACPICLTTRFKVSKTSTRFGQALFCSRCARTFPANDRSVDLTSTAGMEPRVYKQPFWGGTALFRSPFVSFVYERGWRRSFTWAGFPGEEAEFDLAMGYLQSAYGEVLVDMSCGSGLFSRRFVRSGRFKGVIAADFSESMLTQAKQFFEGDASLDARQYMLLRADVGRLPFATGSVAALHAGAAIHCWPNPTAAVAEISRVLQPGGVFVASTFLKASAPLGQLLNNDDVVRPLNSLDPISAGSSNNYQWWEEVELKELTAAMGLQDFQRHRSNRFILFSVRKPAAAHGADPQPQEEKDAGLQPPDAGVGRIQDYTSAAAAAG